MQEPLPTVTPSNAEAVAKEVQSSLALLGTMLQTADQPRNCKPNSWEDRYACSARVYHPATGSCMEYGSWLASEQADMLKDLGTALYSGQMPVLQSQACAQLGLQQLRLRKAAAVVWSWLSTGPGAFFYQIPVMPYHLRDEAAAMAHLSASTAHMNSPQVYQLARCFLPVRCHTWLLVLTMVACSRGLLQVLDNAEHKTSLAAAPGTPAMPQEPSGRQQLSHPAAPLTLAGLSLHAALQGLPQRP